MGDNNVNLPPGFRFYPTDEELVVHFLHRKASLLPCHPDVIPDLDLYPFDPWELNGRALAEGNQWYYYSRRTKNRFTGNGYWKSMGIDEPIFTDANKKVGMKRFFVFCIGEASSSIKTNWTMQEYRLAKTDIGSSSSTTSSKRERRSKKIWIMVNGLFVEFMNEIVKMITMEENYRVWMKFSYRSMISMK